MLVICATPLPGQLAESSQQPYDLKSNTLLTALSLSVSISHLNLPNFDVSISHLSLPYL